MATKAVGELPELQGKIEVFTHKNKMKAKKFATQFTSIICLGPNSELPKTSLGAALAIADKIDSIVGLFLANEKPTSSKDPFALMKSGAWRYPHLL